MNIFVRIIWYSTLDFIKGKNRQVKEEKLFTKLALCSIKDRRKEPWKLAIFDLLLLLLLVPIYGLWLQLIKLQVIVFLSLEIVTKGPFTFFMVIIISISHRKMTNLLFFLVLNYVFKFIIIRTRIFEGRTRK